LKLSNGIVYVLLDVNRAIKKNDRKRKDL
jgi:hypothetical protein